MSDLPTCFFPLLESASPLKRFENDSDCLILLPVFNSCNWSESSQRVLITVKPRYNESLYNEVHGKTNDMLRHYSYSKLYWKEPGYNETSLYRTHFASPLTLRYIEGALYAVFGCTKLKQKPLYSIVLMTPLSYRYLKIRRRRQQRERQKKIRLKSKTTILHVHHAFLFIYMPSLHDFHVKILFSFSFWNGFWFLWIQLQESSPTFDKVIKWSGNNREDDWKNMNSLFKRRFRRPRIRSLLLEV